ncbi:hypothetical protein FRC02_008546 [Tulasnella sp. 418]|nr:hypothetical protein FRC02_008546 [Tulasnella sp. 418]
MNVDILGNLSGDQPGPSSDSKSDPSHVRAAPIEEKGSWDLFDHPNFWGTYVKEAAAYDRRMIDGWFRVLDNLLIYAGLFSAASASFISYTQNGLEANPSKTAVDLLRLILVHRNDNEQFTPEQLGLAPFVASEIDRAVNATLNTSLSCSLLVALGAAIGKDWLTHYDYAVTGVATAHFLSGPVRQRKLNGLKLWQFALLIRLLPFILQVSLVLFFIAVTQHLWRYSVEVALVNLILLIIGVLIYMWTVISTILDRDSPYHSPLSTLILKLGEFTCNLQTPSLSSSIVALRRRYNRLASRLGLPQSDTSEHRSAIYIKIRSWLSYMIKRLGTSKREESPGSTLPVTTSSQDTSGDLPTRTRADCWAWLTVQASDPLVTVLVQQATTLIPPNIALEIVAKQPAVLSQVIRAYNAHIAINTDHNRRAAHPADAIFTGAALFHILKVWKPENDSIAKQVQQIRVLDSNDMHTAIDNKEFWFTVSLVTSCVEMVRDVPRNQLKKLVYLGSQVKHLKKLWVPSASFRFLPAQKDERATLSISPSRLWLDAVTYFAIHCVFDATDERLRAADDARNEMNTILEIIKTMIKDEKNQDDAEFIGHISVTMAAIQVRAAVLRHLNEKSGQCEIGVGRRGTEGVSKVLAAWSEVDKRQVTGRTYFLGLFFDTATHYRKTVFSNITLAFEWGSHDTPTFTDRANDPKSAIYKELLRLSPNYVPAGLRVSWRARDKWHQNWPEAMRMFPAILHFFHHVRPRPEQREQILHLFMKLLPEDWYGWRIDIGLRDYPAHLYPQIHIFSEKIAIYHQMLTDLLKSFLDEWSPGQVNNNLRLYTGNEDDTIPFNLGESVVHILAWMATFRSEKSSRIVNIPYELFQRRTSIPSLLAYVFNTTHAPGSCVSVFSLTNRILSIPSTPGDASFSVQLDIAINTFRKPKMLLKRMELVPFRDPVFNEMMDLNRWLALKNQLPSSLETRWPTPIDKNWYSQDADLVEVPKKADLKAWCWRGLIWTWPLAKEHLSLLNDLWRDDNAIAEEDAAGGGPHDQSNEHNTTKGTRKDLQLIKELIFSEDVVEFVMNFIRTVGVEEIIKDEHLLGIGWIPVAEEYLKAASKEPQLNGFAALITKVLTVLSRYRP